jgi:hypothetical protein
MKRWVVAIAAVGLLVGTAGAAQADQHGGGGGWHGGGGYHGGGNWHGGHWHGGGWHGGYGGSIYLGFGPFWDPFWYPWYPYYYAPPAPVVVSPPATTYIQSEPQEEPDYYWYYCTSPKGYYPYVKKCPQGWLKVVPQPTDD